MYKGTFKHDPYMHPRMIRRANRAGFVDDLKVTFMLELDFDSKLVYPNTSLWNDLFIWLKDRQLTYFTYKLFTNDFKRGFSFVDPKDAMLVKLVWKDAPASGWKSLS